jgi:hypothetical protein
VKNNKTKKVAGVDLSSDCFLYTPDLANTASWMFPVLVRGSEMKTRNLISMHLHRFDAMTAGLPETLRQKLWERLVGAATCMDMHVDRSVLTKTVDTPAQVAEPTSPVKEKPLKRDKHTEEMIAKADRMASAFLKTLGLD